MVKVLRSFVRGPLEPHVAGFAHGLLRQGYSRSSAEQHVPPRNGPLWPSAWVTVCRGTYAASPPALPERANHSGKVFCPSSDSGRSRARPHPVDHGG